MTDWPKVEPITLPLCADCLDGKGGDCVTPGCALWMCKGPAVGLRDMALTASAASIALAEFHGALGDDPGRGNARLRITLHAEEHAEVIDALEDCDACAQIEEWGGPQACDDCRKALARELADLLYIAYGTAHAFNINLDAAFAEVHRAAMSKLFPPNGAERVVREDGKILKPPGFAPPNMTEALR